MAKHKAIVYCDQSDRGTLRFVEKNQETFQFVLMCGEKTVRVTLDSSIYYLMGLMILIPMCGEKRQYSYCVFRKQSGDSSICAPLCGENSITHAYCEIYG